jgi:hypothetical protein
VLNSLPCSLKILKESFSKRKVVCFSSFKKYDKEDHRTLLYAWGAMKLDDQILHQIWTMMSSQDFCAYGVMILKKNKSQNS